MCFDISNKHVVSPIVRKNSPYLELNESANSRYPFAFLFFAKVLFFRGVILKSD